MVSKGAGNLAGENVTDVEVDCVDTCTYTLTQPNGGENWVAGQTYSINWSIPADQAIGYAYRVKLVDSADSSYGSESAGDFIINDPYCNVHIAPAAIEFGEATHQACDLLIVPPGFTAAAGAVLRLSAGSDVVLEPGVAAENGASMEVNVCGQSLCATSTKPMPAECHPCIEQICLLDANCCTAGFDQACVDQVDSVCGLVCE